MPNIRLGKKVYIPVYGQIVEDRVGCKGKDAKAHMERKNGRKMKFKEHMFYASTGRYWEEEE